MKSICFLTGWTLFILGIVHADPAPSIAIQPLGKVSTGDIAFVKEGIEALYAVTVEVLPEKPLPKNAYYASRQRYRADKLLDFLTGQTPDRFDKVVGVTTQDISATKGAIADWGLFGLAELGERACVVSTFRLRAGKASGPLLRIRLVKVVNHELGHTFGLEHCQAPSCMMQEGGGKIATVDGESGVPCAACIRQMSVLRSALLFLTPPSS